MLHLDVHLGEIIVSYGIATYAILFGTIFVETGLVFAPFLPGDSLLFVTGAFAASGSLNVFILMGLLIAAAILGDSTNYWLGHFFGEKIIANRTIKIDQKRLEQTRRFFDKHGGKAIVLGRFVPFIRTFTPFIAGAGCMKYSKFLLFSVTGDFIWVVFFVVTGYFLGNIPFIKSNFSFLVLGVLVVSAIPILVSLVRKRCIRKKTSAK